jgi:hypothetical protein
LASHAFAIHPSFNDNINDWEKAMTLIAHSDRLFSRGIGSFEHQDRMESDGLFVIVIWSIVGLALTGLMIWLGLGAQVESIMGLG